MPIQHRGARQISSRKSSIPSILIRASMTFFSENRVDISNSSIPYTGERVHSVTASKPRNGIKDDTIHRVFC